MSVDTLQKTGTSPTPVSAEILDPLPLPPDAPIETAARVFPDPSRAGRPIGNLHGPAVLRWVPLGGLMRATIAFKIFSIAVGLVILMAVAALLSLRMTQTVDNQLVIVDQNYFPAYVSLAQANIRSVEESALIRRLVLALIENPRDEAKVTDLRQRVTTTGKASDDALAKAREHINEQIADPIDFNDNVELARLDTRIEFLQEERRRYEATYAKLLAAAEQSSPEASRLLTELDGIR